MAKEDFVDAKGPSPGSDRRIFNATKLQPAGGPHRLIYQVLRCSLNVAVADKMIAVNPARRHYLSGNIKHACRDASYVSGAYTAL